MTDSAVAHLAGMLDKPVWNLLPTHTYWIYGLEGEACEWSPAMRLWRQAHPGNWDELFARVTAELQTLAAAHLAAPDR